MRWAGVLAVGLVLARAGVAGAQAEPDAIDSLEDVTDIDLEALLRAPIVESASKRPQSLEEAPGSITVIQGSELQAAGAVTLADALRTVPGLWVYHTDANMFHVGMRGIGLMTSASVLVLINGRRFYDVTVGYAPWAALPLHVGEIQRIEILRGPGAPLYGADALNGVINIVTKHPKDRGGVDAAFAVGVGMLPDEPGTRARQRLGNGGNGYVAVSHSSPDGRWAVRGAVGFDGLAEWQDIDAKGQDGVVRFGNVGYHAGLTADWTPTPELQAWVDARHVLTERQVSFGATPPTSQSIREQSASAGLEKQRFLIEALTLKLGANVRRQNQQGEPVGLDRLVVKMTGYQVLAQADLSLWQGKDILTAGLDGAFRSGGFTGGSTGDISFRQFYGAALLQNETALFDRRLLLNIAGRYEAIVTRSGAGQEARYVNFNPRLSAIVRLHKHHTVRASAATSYRVPTPFHTFANILADKAYAPPVPPAYAVVGNPSLRPEQLRAVELGYRGRLAYWLRLEATLFLQRATGLLQATQDGIPFKDINDLDETAFGIEVGSQLRSSGTLAGYLNYSFLHARSREADRGAVLFPPHLLSVGASGELGAGVRARVDFNHVAAVHHIVFDPATVLLTQAQIPRQEILNLRLARGLEGTSTDLFVQGTNVLAGWRTRSELRQYSNATSAPIGMTIMIGAEVRSQ